MQIIDIIILVFAAILMILDFRKGFIISLASLAGLLLGLYLAVNFSDFTAGLLQKYADLRSAWVPVISFAVTFLLVLVGVLIIGKVVEKMVDLAGMSIFNHLAGGLLGLVKAVLILSVIFFIINKADPNQSLINPESRQKSLFYPYIERIFPNLMSWVGEDLRVPGSD
jgi:membrane protein required for colicin V production